MRHSSDSALSAWSGGVCDSPASSTIVQRVEANKPSRVVSVANVAGMRRFYSVGGKYASQIRERCADSTSGRRNRLTQPVRIGKNGRNSNHAELHATSFAISVEYDGVSF